MTHRARIYLQRKKEFKAWKRDCMQLTLPENFFGDILVKKEVRIPVIGPPPGHAFDARLLSPSRIDEIALIGLPPPEIHHIEFHVRDNRVWKEMPHGTVRTIEPLDLKLPDSIKLHMEIIAAHKDYMTNILGIPHDKF